MNVNLHTRKLKNSIIKVNTRVKENYDEFAQLSVYGVTKDEGVCITGNQASEDLSDYIVVGPKTFAYNPYRVNIGSIGLTDENFQGLVSPAYVVFTTKDDLLPDFLFHYLKSEIGIKQINWYGNRGGVRSALRFDALEELDVPDLTIAEQHIALKRIEKLKFKITTLTKELTQQQSYLQLLRQTILQEAVRGKLTHREPTDEPAAVLLARIKAEKAQLVKAGKLKKEKELPPITEAEMPFELPEGWVWCRLGEIIKLQNGYAFESSKYQDGGVRLVRNINIGHGNILWKDIAYYPKDAEVAYSDFNLNPHDILISLDRPIISSGLKIARVTEEDLPALLVQRVARIKVSSLMILPDFLYLWFNSPLFVKEISPGRSNGIPHISTKEVEQLPFPLPPLTEQSSIVFKIQELQQYLETLEVEVKQSHSQVSKLLQAVLQEAFIQQETSKQEVFHNAEFSY